MLDISNILISLLDKIMYERHEMSKTEFKVFVEDMFYMTEKVYQNLFEILSNAEKSVRKGEMTAKDAISYFNDNRIPLKSTRAKIRGIVKHSYYTENQELAWFALGIMCVLQGGLSGENIEIIDSEDIIEYVRKFGIRSDHTIVDLMKRYDKYCPYAIYYDDGYALLTENEQFEYVRQNLLRDIEMQRLVIDGGWQLVCDYYPKLL